MTPDTFAAILRAFAAPSALADERAVDMTMNLAPLLLDLWRAADRLSRVLDLASSVHTPERRTARLAFRAALAALEAST